MASRSASRTVCLTICVPAGTSGSATRATRFGRALVSAVGRFFFPHAVSAVAGFFSPMSMSASGLRMLPPCSGWVCASRCAACCAPAPSRADLSSPSPRSRAIGSLTFTPSVPAWTRILPSVPSSTASTSMVALSVSISAITSPDLTESPSFFSHLARLPSVIVGESAGIRIGVGIGPLPRPRHSRAGPASTSSKARSGRLRFGQDVRPQLRGVRLRRVLGEARGLVDDVADLLVEPLEPLLVALPAVEHPLAQALDRVVPLPHLLHLLLRAVLGGIGHRVAA